ncbi:MAG: hypothetical protein QXF76_00810 [Candidatus Anstonellales archaeon]
MKLLAEEGNTIKLLIENVEDIRVIHSIISINDRITMKTIRKIKHDESSEAEKKQVTIKLKVEKKEYNNELKKLKILGKIIECSDENVKLNSYHSFDVEIKDSLTIEKDHWDNLSILSIQRALNESKKRVLLLLLVDEQSCIIANITNTGYEIKTEINAGLSKESKTYVEDKIKYFNKILNYLTNLKEIEPLVIAGPGFFKEELAKFLKEKIKLKSIKITTASYVNHSGLHELLSSEDMNEIIKEYLVTEQLKIVNAFLEHLSKNRDDIIYGFDYVKQGLDYNAINQLIVLESLLDNQDFRDLVNKAIDLKIKVHIIADDSDPGKLFSAFKIGAFTKFKIIDESTISN